MGCAVKIICNNKKAYHNYFILDSYEAGIELKGSEVKSVKSGGMSINDAFISVKNGEVFLKNAYIKPYDKATNFIPLATRTRKLLLNRFEIDKILKQQQIKGNSIIPLKVYVKNGLVKVEIATAKGKKLYDKREVLKQKAIKMAIERERGSC